MFVHIIDVMEIFNITANDDFCRFCLSALQKEASSIENFLKIILSNVIKFLDAENPAPSPTPQFCYLLVLDTILREKYKDFLLSDSVM